MGDPADLSRYVGRCNAIAHVPASFERACAQGTTVTYAVFLSGPMEA